MSVATGIAIQFDDATEANNPVVLDPAGATPVYVRDPDCSITVSDA